jgi:lipopolysaccharide/colanic/teichoic acid biosynthesis glycosyltransferase
LDIEPLRSGRPSTSTLAIKRSVDLLASAVALTLLLPVLAVVAVAIKADSKGPVFFTQTRVGKDKRLFSIRKFRSMVVEAPQLGGSLTLRGDARVTQVGRVLRRHKLDELPQLINVLLGEMSLVGPRPEVPDLMRHYTPRQTALICSVAPGITDYASILFRDESALLSGNADPQRFYREVIMPIKAKYYARYIADISLFTDLRIIGATIALLIVGSPLGLPKIDRTGLSPPRREIHES